MRNATRPDAHERTRPFGAALVSFLATVLGTACEPQPAPGSSFYDERIAPIVDVGCVQQTTGCHLAAPDGTAAGNLDMSSYDALSRRRDALAAYGPYPVGLVLLKGGEPANVSVESYRQNTDGVFVETITTDIRHAAGSLISLDSSGYAQLKQWIQNGASRSGVPTANPRSSSGGCVNGVGHALGFDPSVAIDTPLYGRFLADVQPVLRSTCAGSHCHGNPNADLFLACGDTDEERRWNFHVTVAHLESPASTSELLRRPLSTLRGGVYHEGGDVFASTEDPGYQVLAEFAQAAVDADPDVGRHPASLVTPGFEFFVSRVQPVLVREGCMFLGCHSPSMFHDLRLRGGSGGVFSRIAMEKNYEMSRLMLALESPDPNQSRLIAKNLYDASLAPGAAGMPHRGGSLFEDFPGAGGLNPADPTDCAGVDADTDDLADVPSYCVLARWHQIEREAAQVEDGIFDDAEVVRAVVYVSRPAGIGDVRDFDTFRGGASLMRADATVDVAGALTLVAPTNLLPGCGLGATADVRNPAVSWDGTRVAFAARASAGAPLRLYWMNEDGSDCALVPDIRSGDDTQNGILVHDFDPAFAPDGRLVFASTRGHALSGFSYSGPTRTPAAMQPNANLYVRETDGAVRALTFLLNQEVAPSFMLDGRVIFTAEKREPDFHQLALRRQNLDGGDYHPLFAQRPSVGFARATEVVEMPNRNFVFVASNHTGADGAGGIVVLNRSVGPDQTDRDAADRFYVHSMDVAFPGAFGVPSGVPGGSGNTGVFRSPSPLPSGRILASCDTGAGNVTAGPFTFGLCELDPRTGTIRALTGSGASDVEPVAIYARVNHGVFVSRSDEANGATRVIPGDDEAIVLVHDFPMLATLLFANARTGRPIDPAVGGFDVFEALPPPAGTTSFSQVSADVVMDAFGPVYRRYEFMGNVGLEADGSARFRFPGGVPIVLRATSANGTPLEFPADGPFAGEMFQREQMQFYPGERSNQSMRRTLFNGLCAGCHGSITNRELDVFVNPDVLTSASRSLAAESEPTVVAH